jgi:hypothetical protein
MTKRNYWLDLFTGVTWQEFKAASQFLRFMKPEFLEEIPESCEIEEI